MRLHRLERCGSTSTAEQWRSAAVGQKDTLEAVCTQSLCEAELRCSSLFQESAYSYARLSRVRVFMLSLHERAPAVPVPDSSLGAFLLNPVVNNTNYCSTPDIRTFSIGRTAMHSKMDADACCM